MEILILQKKIFTLGLMNLKLRKNLNNNNPKKGTNVPKMGTVNSNKKAI